MRIHLRIGICLILISVFAGFYFTRNIIEQGGSSPANKSSRQADRSPTPDLPAYLLKLCGTELVEAHDGAQKAANLPIWFQNAAKTLAAKGLSWPTPRIGLDDHTLKSNVEEYESRYAPMLESDPEAAVKMLEPLIRYEEDKYIVRTSRAALKESAEANNGIPKSEVYTSMLAELPSRYFSRVIEENLDLYPEPSLVAAVIDEAKRRDPKERFAGLAVVANHKKIDSANRQSAAEILAPALHVTLTGSSIDEINWPSLVSETFPDSESSASY
jgi:hypothetical protein